MKNVTILVCVIAVITCRDELQRINELTTARLSNSRRRLAGYVREQETFLSGFFGLEVWS